MLLNFRSVDTFYRERMDELEFDSVRVRFSFFFFFTIEMLTLVYKLKTFVAIAEQVLSIQQFHLRCSGSLSSDIMYEV